MEDDEDKVLAIEMDIGGLVDIIVETLGESPEAWRGAAIIQTTLAQVLRVIGQTILDIEGNNKSKQSSSAVTAKMFTTAFMEVDILISPKMEFMLRGYMKEESDERRSTEL